MGHVMTDQEAQEQPRKHTKPTRRAWIMRGVVTPIFGLLAVACIVFGVLNSTVWKPSRNITATAQAHSTQYVVIDPGVLDLVDTAVTVSADNGKTASSSGTEAGRNITATAQAHSTQYVVIDPGVLDLVDTAVTVSADNGKTASSSGTEAGADAAEDSQNQQTSQDQQAQTEPQVCMAVGSPKDVSGWLAGEPYVRVTGLDTWQTLSTSEEQAKGTASTSQNQVAFADSDMWSQVECGSTSTTMHLNNAQPAQVMLIDFGTKAPSADLSMHAFADSDMWSQVECGSTSTTMHLNNAQPAQVMLIDFGTKAPSADLSMQWVRQRVPDFALPWYFGGGLCAVLAVLSASVFAMEPHTRRKKQAESAQAKPKAAKSADEPTIGAALVGTFAALKPRPKKAGAKGSARHGRHAGAAEDESRQQGAPTVVDPGARNIVAEHANRNAGGETAEHDHGRHAGAAEDESRQQGAPTVVDPGARNIVAEHANRNAGGETAEHDGPGSRARPPWSTPARATSWPNTRTATPAARRRSTTPAARRRRSFRPTNCRRTSRASRRKWAPNRRPETNSSPARTSPRARRTSDET